MFHIEIEEKGGWIIGGAKGYVGPPSKIIGGAWPPLAPPLPTPMKIVKEIRSSKLNYENRIAKNKQTRQQDLVKTIKTSA